MNTAKDAQEKVTILIIDDDLSAQKSLSLIFRKRGYETHAVGTGREALDAARERPFNAVLLDIKLPDVQGTDLIEPLKELQPDVEIIVATGFATLDTSMAALNRGAVGYITKPLSMGELLARLDEVLEKQRLMWQNRQLYEELQMELAQRSEDQEIIKKAADEWRITFDSIPDLISIHDENYRFTRVNNATADLLKTSPKELIGKHCYEVVHGTKKPPAFCPHKKVLETKKGIREEIFEPNLGIYLQLVVSPLLDSNGAVVGTVHVMKDITARKRAEEALKESEGKYREIFDMAITGINRTSPDGRFIEVNPAFCRILGYDSAEELMKSITSIGRQAYVDPERREEIKERLAKDGSVRDFEAELRRKDGTIIWVSIDATAIYDEKGEMLYYQGGLLDITGRKRAERRLTESEQRYRELFENMSSGVAVYEVIDGGKDFIFRDFNKAGERIDGDKREDIIGKSVFAVRPGIEEFGLIDVFRRVYKTGKPERLPIALYEDNKLHKWYENFIYKLPSGEIVAVYDDVTEQKLMDQRLIQSESLLNSSQHLAKVGGWDWNVDSQTMFWTDETYRIHGLSAGEIEPGLKEHVQKSVECYDPDDRPVILSAFNRCITKGEPYDLEFPFTTYKNERRWIRTAAEPVFEKGKVVRVIGTLMDITKRKRAEDALRESEARLRLAYEAANAAAWEWDLLTNRNIWSDEIWELYGLEPHSCEPSYEAWRRIIHPDDRAAVEAGVRDAVHNGTELNAEWRVNLPDGGLRWLMSRGKPQYGEDGKITGYIGIVIDITNRKRAEQALKQSEEKFRGITEVVPEAFFIYSAQTSQYEYLSPAFEEMFGRSLADHYENPALWYESVHPDDRQRVAEDIFNSLDTGFAIDFRIVRPNGSVRWVFSRSFPEHDEKGNILRLIGANQDITDRKLAEEALREWRDRYDLVVAASGQIAYEYHVPSGDILWGPTMKRVLGYDTEEYGGGFEQWLEWLHPEDKEETLRYLAESEAKCAYWDAEYRLRAKDGRYVWIRDRGFFVPDDNGKAQRQMGMLEDVTERKAAEEALRDSEEKYRSLVENINDVLFNIDLNGMITYISPVAQEITGLAADDYTGKYFAEFVHPEDIGELSKNFKRALTGFKEDAEFRTRTKDGSYISVRSSSNPIMEEGSVVGLTGLITDITERKKAEEALRDSEQKFHSLFETSKDFLCITDLDGKIVDANEAALEFFGYSYEELPEIGMWNLYAHAEDRQVLITKILEKGYVSNYEMKLKKKSGETIDGLMTVSLRRDKDGNPIGFFGSVKDITEKRKLEQQLLQSEKLSAVGTMISGVAHELNNPLTSIIGNSQLLAKRDVPEDIKRKLEIILKESIRSSKIVSGLLAFAREHRPEQKMIAVNDILRETIKLREYDLVVSNIDVRLSLSEDLPRTFADPYQLQQVFINLINNARDALAEKEGAALIIRTYRDKTRIFVDFEDNGPGIEKDDLAKIFDPFFTTKEVGKGTGLGLSMAYGIVKEHDGTISVESEAGKGAKFVVALPIREGPLPAPKRTKPPVRISPDTKNVLVVEDEESLRDLLVEAISGEGFSTDAASNGQEAMAMIGEKDYDAVVSDIKMPGVGGRELFLFVQKNHPDLADRIIFITGDILSKDTQSFLQITNNRFIEKPFNIDAFLALLSDVLAG